MGKAKKIKLLIVVNYFYPYISGVSEYARSLAKSLSKTHEIIVLTGRHLKALKSVEIFEGYTIYRADPIFFLNKGYISLKFFKVFRLLAAECDIINLHFPMIESGLLSYMSNKPIVLTYHCDMALVGGFISRLAVLVTRISGFFAIKKAKRIVVSSKDYALNTMGLQKFKTKTFEIFPPNRFEDFDIKESILNFKRSDNSSICGFVGRFVEEKGIETILGVAHRFKTKNIRFWIAGDYKNIAGGSIYNKIEQHLKKRNDKIKLLGKLTDDELASFYKTIDILLLPSINRFEAFGMVQLEAMSFGALVVTSDMPGVRETVKQTGMGDLIVPGSINSLEKAITRTLEMRKSISRKKVIETKNKIFVNSNFISTYKYLIRDLSNEN